MAIEDRAERRTLTLLTKNSAYQMQLGPLDYLLHLLLVSVEHQQEIRGQLKTLLVPVAVLCAWQPIAIQSINNTLNIISSPIQRRQLFFII